MHIIYIHQYFNTPEESAATRSYWFAKALIEKGHRVTMITSTNDKKHPKAEQVIIDGINVVYVKNDYSQYFSKIRKIYSFAKFIVLAIIQASKVKNVDLVFATSTPLSVGAIALYLNYRKKWNYVFEVRDLWPEFPIQIGAIRNRTIISILKKFELKIYQKSKRIIALSPGMAEGVLATGIPKNMVTMIPNMSKPDLFYPRKKDEEYLTALEIDTNKLNIIHFGSMGVANGLEYIIETADILQNKGVNDICFYLVGGGATYPKLTEQVKKNNLLNVKFPGFFNLYEISEIVNCCDLSIISFKDLPILYTNSPNKLFDSLSAGKPIVVNSAGWTKELVEKYNCGYYVNPKDPKEFANLLISINTQSVEFKEKGENARRISIDIFDKQKLSEKFVSVIESVHKKNNFHV